jgi:hypothetical protein
MILKKNSGKNNNRKSEMAEAKKYEEEGKQNRTFEGQPVLEPQQEQVYHLALQTLNQKKITYAVGAAFARHAYTSIWRYTKDLDIFLPPKELKSALEALSEVGFETKVVDGHWLAKARKDGYFIDLIFGTGHGQIPVDEDSFHGSTTGEIVGVQTNLIPVEEMIASAAYIAGRNRFDGGDIVHLIRSTQGKLDWQRILNRLGENRGELLLWYLILFDFIYPGHSEYLPRQLMVDLFEQVRLRWENQSPNQKKFRGSILDPYSYIVDIEDWGYIDMRNTEPLVNDEGEVI